MSAPTALACRAELYRPTALGQPWTYYTDKLAGNEAAALTIRLATATVIPGIDRTVNTGAPMKKSDITRARILEGSLKAMSRYGYDGASMDVIAREGGVNKSLIYYYFKSKEEIRRTLVDDFMGGLAELIRHWGDEPVDMFGDDTVRHVFGEVFSFLNAHSALLRIVLIESIKEKRRDNELLDMVMSLVAEFRRNPEALSRAMNLNLRPDETEGQTLVTEFFTLFAPLILFVVLADSWGSYFGVSRETLEQQFVRAIRETHISRHKG